MNANLPTPAGEPRTHVVFGAGQIGTPLATLLKSRGHRVRLVRRAGGGPAGVEVVHGDATAAVFAARAAHGADVIYHCMNPAYDARLWREVLPRLMDSLVGAAHGTGARLVVLDNLYMLGDTRGQPMNEETPVNPCSRKGELRARVAERLFAAHARGDVRAVCGRAADFYGPGGRQTYFGDAMMPRLLAGKSAQVLSDPAIVHAYHYTLDVAAGLATLGEAPDDAYGGWWMLPAAPADTTLAMLRRIGEALGRAVRTERVPGVVLGAMGLFVPFMRELKEMQYQFDAPFLVDDRRFRSRFGATATALDDGARALVAWAREAYAAAGARG